MGKAHKSHANPLPRKAIVLAAGRGRRQRPYTDKTPKPLLSIGGRPTLDYVLNALARAGAADVCLVTGYLAEQIEAYVGDGLAWGLKACYRRQESRQGTAHALLAAREFITGPCFVVAADYALAPDALLELSRAFSAAGSALAVSLKALPPGELNKRSSVRFQADGEIAEIIEKPNLETAPSAIGASLIFIVTPEILPYLDRLALSPRGEYELQSIINQMLKDGFKVTGLLGEAPLEWQPQKHG